MRKSEGCAQIQRSRAWAHVVLTQWPPQCGTICVTPTRASALMSGGVAATCRSRNMCPPASHDFGRVTPTHSAGGRSRCRGGGIGGRGGSTGPAQGSRRRPGRTIFYARGRGADISLIHPAARPALTACPSHCPLPRSKIGYGQQEDGKISQGRAGEGREGGRSERARAAAAAAGVDRDRGQVQPGEYISYMLYIYIYRYRSRSWASTTGGRTLTCPLCERWATRPSTPTAASSTSGSTRSTSRMRPRRR
jgi:hypothetical protein